RARPEIGGTRITWPWLKSLTRRECLWRFRFYPEELVDIANAMRIPDPFWTSDGSRFSSLEALCLLLARFKTAGDQYELSAQYCRSQCAISELVNELAAWIDTTWRHLMLFDTDGLLAPERIEMYADAIFQAGSPLEWIWSFIDCTIRAICHPTWNQGQMYSGHKRLHAMKYQAL
ncbi:hypothetical protein C8R46DRAFT_848491, partial [Mycena filopes]